MKYIFKTILKYYLKYISKLVLYFHEPTIIAVAGSTNKHFVKQELKKVIQARGYKVRANSKNFNTEIGLPLAILDLPSGYNSYKKWLPVIKTALGRIVLFDFPPYLVLSLGSSDPGDMKYLLSIVKPKVVVLTNLTQRYAEGFNGFGGLVNEYKSLVEKLSDKDLLIVNADNDKLYNLRKYTKANVLSYSIDNDADYKADIINASKEGTIFRLRSINANKHFDIQRYGRHHVYAKLVSFIVDEKLLNK